ncbi:MAG: copper transporter [Acidimicrobiia bacterium]|nr:copper transporter [Acidimicrobiia bacterium]
MINLRYHVVSLIAVFLALTVGIVMGSTVVDRVTVDALNERVSSVSKSVSNAEAENGRLSGQLGTVRDFADQARDHVVRDQLRGVPVLIAAVAGVDRKPVEGLQQVLVESGATMAGTLWFTGKMRLDNDADRRELATVLNLADERPDVVRAQALAKVADALDGSADPNPDPTIAALTAAGFVTYEAPPGQAASTIPPSGAIPESVRVVLVSGAGAGLGDDEVALPLAQDLGQGGGRLVAVESGQDTPGGRGVFVGLVRNDDEVGARVSTVDNLESPMGQAAVVLALEDLAVPRTGHFGVGPGAQRLLPAGQT